MSLSAVQIVQKLRRWLDAADQQLVARSRAGDILKWSRLFGQFGGKVKLIPGFDYAASRSVSDGGSFRDR